IETENKINAIATNLIKKNELKVEAWISLNAIEKVELSKKMKIPCSMLYEIDKLSKAQKGAKMEWFNSGIKMSLIRESDFFYFSNKQDFNKDPKLKIESIDSLPKKFLKSEIYVDATKISGELRVR